MELAFISLSMCFIFIFQLVPSSPPANISITHVTATSMTVVWDEVPVKHQNGDIEGYLVFYRPHFSQSQHYDAQASKNKNLTLTNLKHGTSYALRVLAYTTTGNGIASKLLKVSTTVMSV